MRTPRGLWVTAVMLVTVSALHGQADPSGEWRTLHTPHFRIHFRPAYRSAALLEANEAERAYALLGAELHPPRETVDLTLTDDVDESNGFTTPFPSDRITIFLPAPTLDPALSDFDLWLRLVTTHELTHIFHLDRVRGVWSILQDVFGRAPGLFPNGYQPPWVTEGLAEYYESRLSSGGRVRGGFQPDLLRAIGAGGAARAPWDVQYFSRWPGGLGPYAYGGRFFSFLSDSLGDSVVPRFVETAAGQWIPYRVGHPLFRVGVDLSGTWLRATIPPPAPDDSARVLAGGLYSEPVPRVSPDGKRLAYLWDDGRGPHQLRVVDATSLAPIAEHRVHGAARYDWDGDTLLVDQLDFVNRFQIRSDRYRWVPGQPWRRETRGARLVAPRAGGGVVADVAFTPSGTRPRVSAGAAPDSGAEEWGEVVPSPDGRVFAATRHAAGHWTLVSWPVAHPESVAVLVTARGVLSDPVWAPGGALLFAADADGSTQVYRSSGAGPARALTRAPGGARAPALLADGSLVVATLGAGGWELARVAPMDDGPAFADTLPATVAPASAAPVRETGYDAGPSLAPRFWIPLFVDHGRAGRFGGLATAGTDALGRYTYAMDLLASLDPRRLVADGALIVQRFRNPTFDLSGSADWSYLGTTSTGIVVSESKLDAALGASWVRVRWHRVASVRVAAEYEGRRFTALPSVPLDSVCNGCSRRDLVGGSVTFALAHSIFAPLAISSERGYAWSLTLRRREQQGSAAWSDEEISRLNLYLGAPGPSAFAHSVLALRFAAGATQGPVADFFDVGGVSSGSFDLGFGQALGSTRDFPVRGYPPGILSARRAVSAAVEYRLPLALVGRSLGHLPLGLDKLSLAFFGDAGDAWNPGAPFEPARLRSAGAELVGDLNLGYQLALRLRGGLGWPLAPAPGVTTTRPSAYVAFSSDF